MTASIPAYFGEFMRTFGITASDWSGSDTNGQFQFRAVVYDTSNQGQVLLASDPTKDIVGVLINDPRANESCQIAFIGEVKVLAGGTIAYGDPLTIDADGRFITWTTGSTNTIYGRARMPAAAKDIITAVINCGAWRNT